MPATLLAAVGVAIGLLLGSVLPAELLARRRGIDIRAVGDGNPGTVNALRGMGWAAGLATVLYDAAVGVVSIRIALWLGVAEGPAYLAGIAGVVGHRFPVFSRFRGGGQGMAASAGLLVYGLGLAVSRGWLFPIDVGGLLVILLIALAVTRSGSAAAIVMLPCLVVRLILARTDWQFLAFASAVAAYIWLVQAARAGRWLASGPVRPAGGETRG